MPLKRSVPPLLFVLIAALLWSTGGLFIKWTSLNGFELSCLRSVFAFLTVAIVARKQGFGINRLTAAASCLYAILLITFVVATKQTTAANAIFLQYTSPVYLLILEPIFYKEKFRSKDLVTVGVCLCGMALFFVGQLRTQDFSGNIIALVSGLCFALYFLTLRHPRAKEVNRASSVIYGNLLVVLVTAPWGIAAVSTLNTHDVLSVVYLGVIQLGISYLIFTKAMGDGVRSLDAGIVCYIEPVLNPVWVFLVLGERPSQWALVGGAIIILAVMTHMIVDASGKRQSKPTPLESVHT